MSDYKRSVLMVCLGNICRSPTAEAIFRKRVEAAGLADQIRIDSAGTAEWHIGNPPDARSIAAAARRGYDLSSLRGRQVGVPDFAEFDYILAMDKSNLANLEALKPAGYQGHLGLFLAFTDAKEQEVPDPYYGGEEGFEHVVDLIESASDGLIAHIRDDLKA